MRRYPHVAQGSTKSDVNGIAWLVPWSVKVSCTGPERWLVAVTESSDLENRVDRRSSVVFVCCAGRPAVVNNALQFLRVGKPPVAVAKVFRRVPLLNPFQRRLPVHAGTAVLLGPHECRSLVGNRAVAVVPEVVHSVARIAANVPDVPSFGEAIGEEPIPPASRCKSVLNLRAALRISRTAD